MNLPDTVSASASASANANATPAITLYGIAHCDTIKKARAWLSTQGLAYHFHDFKKHGVPAGALQGWMGAVGWEALVNRRGTTWRQLDAATQTAACDAASAATLLAQHASTIKRPVVEWRKAGTLLHTSVGFEPVRWAQWAAELRS